MRAVWRCSAAILASLSVVSRAQGEKWVNRTIDDQLGDEATGRLVTYTPPGVWSQGNGCGYCALKPDNHSALDGTWHDGFHDPNRDVEPLAFEFKFNGTAVYIFNILVKQALTNVNITLDGQLVNTYAHTPDLTNQFAYNASVFSKENIPYGEHTVGVSAFGPNQTNVLFDYAIYTTNVTDDTSTTNGTGTASTSPRTSHSRNIAGPVAGGVVGGVVFISVVIFGLWWYRRRGRKAASVTPFISKTRQPFDGMLASPVVEKVIDVGQIYDPSSLKIDSNDVTETDPSTGRSEDTSGFRVSTPTSQNDSLHDDVQALRDQLASIVHSSRTTQAFIGTPATSTYQSSPTHITTNDSKPSRRNNSSSDIQNDIRSLRQQVEQLRAQQDARGNVVPPSPSPPAGGALNLDLVQEIASLRSEIQELRIQQEILAGPLPEYSPPERPLAGFGGVGAEQVQ